MNDSLVDAVALGVQLDGHRIIEGISFAAHGGQTVAVVGPNGAGKTTLLRALAGLIPSTGTLRVAGDDPRKLSAEACARRRAYCAQKPASAWDYRLRDLGEIIGKSAGFAGWLEKLGLERLAERRLRSLSGGEQKGAHLAMAFASLPEPFGGVLLLDEPSAALDLGRQETVREAIRAFAQAGAACVVATHDLGHARRCDLVLVLNNGRLASFGRPGDVLKPDVISAIWGESMASAC